MAAYNTSNIDLLIYNIRGKRSFKVLKFRFRCSIFISLIRQTRLSKTPLPVGGLTIKKIDLKLPGFERLGKKVSAGYLMNNYFN